MSYKLFTPNLSYLCPLFVIPSPLARHSTHHLIPWPHYVLDALSGLCSLLTTHPHLHLPETDLLLLSTWIEHVLLYRFIFIPQDTGGWSKLGQSNFSLGLTQKKFLWFHMYQKKEREHCFRRIEHQIHWQEQRQKSDVWSGPPSWFMLFLRPAAFQSSVSI